MIFTYIKAKECNNSEAWFSCLKCGKCGRVFKSGYLVDQGGTTSEDKNDECFN
jgi:hypothetical protein